MMRASLLSICVLSLCVSFDVRAQSAAGIRWMGPAAWKVAGPRPMRAATYTIAVVPGDFKLTGPAKTIAAQQAAFDQMLASIQPE